MKYADVELSQLRFRLLNDLCPIHHKPPLIDFTDCELKFTTCCKAFYTICEHNLKTFKRELKTTGSKSA